MNPSTLSPAVSEAFTSVFNTHPSLHKNLTRAELITHALEAREAIATKAGALATWNPPHSTGRIPKDTYMVRDSQTENTVDWNASACIAMQPEHFDMLLADALKVLEEKEKLYVLERSVGHDATTALDVQLLSSSALGTLFADNMFCPSFSGKGEPFTLVHVPEDDMDTIKYQGILREENGEVVPRLVAMDFTRRIGLVYGSSYCGCIKKTLFTVMNYLLPEQGVLPLHCSANEGPEGSALFLGLSGTGKTTLSNDPERTLIGDDEHGWNESGVFNMEGGCYAKLINLRPDKEPDIFRAVFEPKPLLENGCILENAMVYPNGVVDVDDARIAENSRASYPLSFLPNTREHAVTKHPKTIIFLTADASGVLPPVAKLSRASAMLWFLMGYTSKLAGTELGVTQPKASFSRFFGAPFMPCHPSKYADLLGAKLDEHGSDVYLINTGWTGGPYGVGTRFDINLTRTLVDAALDGSLKHAPHRTDERFRIEVPTVIDGVESSVLDPVTTWNDMNAYNEAADALAAAFATEFQKQFGEANLDQSIIDACPGM